MNPDDSSTFRLLQEVTFAGNTEFISYMNGVKWFRIGTRATASSLWSWSPWSKTVTGADKVIGQDGLNSSGSFNTGNMTIKHNLKAAGLTDSANTGNNVIRNLVFDNYGHIINYESSSVDAVPTGTVIYFASQTAPTGYLKCNGSYISRDTYQQLFLAIGTTFGTNSATNFRLPDLRGQFIRSWSDGSTVDSGRTFGSTQAQQIQRHKHMTAFGENVVNTQWGIFGASATRGKAGTRDPSYDVYWYHTNDGSDYDGVVNAAGVIGNETRPTNIALLACIKY
jgi:microcystin-dependent protein